MSINAATKTTTALKLLLGMSVFGASLWAAGFWDKKEFVNWSGKELQKLFTDSPWAKKVSVAAGPPPGQFDGGGRGGGGRRGGGGGVPGGGGAGGRGGGGFGGGGGMQSAQMAPSIPLIVRFDEAQPIREAKVKYRLGEGTELPPDWQRYLDQEQDYYVVTVEGLPQMLARFAEEPERLVTTAKLRRKKKSDITPAKVEVSAENSVIFRYYFVKADPIELADREVEFYMKLDRPQGAQMGAAGGRQGPQGQRQGGQGQGQRPGAQQRGQGPGGRGPGAARGAMMARALFGKEIKRKFRLKDMVYKGELAL